MWLHCHYIVAHCLAGVYVFVENWRLEEFIEGNLSNEFFNKSSTNPLKLFNNQSKSFIIFTAKDFYAICFPDAKLFSLLAV